MASPWFFVRASDEVPGYARCPPRESRLCGNRFRDSRRVGFALPSGFNGYRFERQGSPQYRCMSRNHLRIRYSCSPPLRGRVGVGGRVARPATIGNTVSEHREPGDAIPPNLHPNPKLMKTPIKRTTMSLPPVLLRPRKHPKKAPSAIAQQNWREVEIDRSSDFSSAHPNPPRKGRSQKTQCSKCLG